MIYADKTNVFSPKKLSQYSLKATDGEYETAATVKADFASFDYEVTEGWISGKHKTAWRSKGSTTKHISITPQMNDV